MAWKKTYESNALGRIWVHTHVSPLKYRCQNDCCVGIMQITKLTNKHYTNYTILCVWYYFHEHTLLWYSKLKKWWRRFVIEWYYIHDYMLIYHISQENIMCVPRCLYIAFFLVSLRRLLLLLLLNLAQLTLRHKVCRRYAGVRPLLIFIGCLDLIGMWISEDQRENIIKTHV